MADIISDSFSDEIQIEAGLIFDKEFVCPACDNHFLAKIMKSSKAKLIGTDSDLKPNYEGIDSVKYDVVMCDKCGYAALVKNFTELGSNQRKAINENINGKVKIKNYHLPIYTYEHAAYRYTIALACCAVKHVKSSERALVSLKAAWLYRGYVIELEKTGENIEKIAELKIKENEYLKNAYNGFIDAREKESFPIAGMDTATLDLIIAQLGYRFGEYDTATKLIGGILTFSSNERIKNKARDLKDLLLKAKSSNNK